MHQIGCDFNTDHVSSPQLTNQMHRLLREIERGLYMLALKWPRVATAVATENPRVECLSQIVRVFTPTSRNVINTAHENERRGDHTRDV